MAEVVIVADAVAGGEIAARILLRTIKTKRNAVLGLATGSTPGSCYQALARLVKEDGVDVSEVRGFGLDEYVGLPAEHPQSYHSVINRDAVEPIGLTPGNVHLPCGDLDTLEGEGERFEQAITDAGGVDVQLLGIGRSGHIGFNEPGSSLSSLTRVKVLTETTRADNARFFDHAGEMPLHCITQGIGTILRARHLVLLAFGPSKAGALAAAVEGPVTASQPGSAIQLHPHVTVIADEDAAAMLENVPYYRLAYSAMLPWERL